MNKRLLNTLVIGILIVSSITAILIKRYIRTTEMIYTLGTITEFYKPVKGGRLLKFQYIIDGEKYESSSSYLKYEDKVEIGQIYYVEVPKNYKGSGLILLDKPYKGGKNVPDEGWSEKPF